MTYFESKENRWTISIVLGLVCISLLIAYMTSKINLLVAPFSILGLVGISLMLVINYNFKIGIFFLLGIGTFMNFISRFIGRDLPFGLMFDGLIILIFFFFFSVLKKIILIGDPS